MQKERTESAAGKAKAAIEDAFGLPPVDKAPVTGALSDQSFGATSGLG
jgi:hypothetical protein